MEEKQLEFWDILPFDEQQVKRSFAETKDQIGNLRRGIFARHDVLERKIEALEEEVRLLKEKHSLQKPENPSFWDQS